MASEGQAAGVYGTGFTAGSIVRVATRDRSGIEVILKKLEEWLGEWSNVIVKRSVSSMQLEIGEF